jgi:tRNA1Val (adenine37-N6)-methyltransferase
MTIFSTKDLLKRTGKATGTFYFKQFKVEDGWSTMKVGTDAVLLGALADTGNAAKILEIGTGSGVIALILAQRCSALIDAIEVDENSACQARENVNASPWKDRIRVIHGAFQEFSHHAGSLYDLVISNPPYFSRCLKSPDEKRNIARHNDSLSFEELVDGAARVMSPFASLWVILPARESVEFIEIAKKNGFHIHSLLKIFSGPGQANHRIIIQLKKIPADKVIESSLSIKDNENRFSNEYIEVTKELYIDF